MDEETYERLSVPDSEFSIDLLEMNLLMAIMSGLSSEGLHFHHATPNLSGIFEYARVRWRYFDLDVEHAPLDFRD